MNEILQISFRSYKCHNSRMLSGGTCKKGNERERKIHYWNYILTSVSGLRSSGDVKPCSLMIEASISEESAATTFRMEE